MAMDWDDLRIFRTVAEAGTITGAAKVLGRSQSAVSRHIAALETDLKVSLFRRHASGIVLTEPGEELQRAVGEMAARLQTSLSAIDESRELPTGPLRVTTSITFGSAWLGARINRFRTLHPDVLVSLILVDNAELDLTLGDADVAVRFALQTQPSLVQKRLMSIKYHVFASREYLADHGAPASVSDLADHDIIVYGDDVAAPVNDINWLLDIGLEDEAPREPALRVNSVYGIYRAAKSGLGIAALPYYVTEETPELVEILPNLEGPTIDVYLVYPEELRWSKRIAAFRDFLEDETASFRKEAAGRRREALGRGSAA
jgi:DNA-binding transcriptional LysR family regulator